MDAEQDVAAAMGFTAFGAQPGSRSRKKQRLGTSNSDAAPQDSTTAAANTAANTAAAVTTSRANFIRPAGVSDFSATTRENTGREGSSRVDHEMHDDEDDQAGEGQDDEGQETSKLVLLQQQQQQQQQSQVPSNQGPKSPMRDSRQGLSLQLSSAHAPSGSANVHLSRYPPAAARETRDDYGPGSDSDSGSTWLASASGPGPGPGPGSGVGSGVGSLGGTKNITTMTTPTPTTGTTTTNRGNNRSNNRMNSRNGVWQGDQGGYYDVSFVEDPWAGLRR